MAKPKLPGPNSAPRPPTRREGRLLLAWTGLTLTIIACTVFVIRNAPPASHVAAIDAVRTVPDPAPGLEQKRLAEKIRAITSEREKLGERIAALEESLKDVTASVPRARDPAPPPRPAEAVTAPRSGDRLTVVPRAPSPSEAPAPIVSVPSDPAPPAFAVPDSQLIRSEFAAEIATGASLDALRLAWANLKGNNGKILDGLRPVVGVRDGKPGAPPELVLRIGPIGNMATAAQLCARLGTAAPACRPTIFDGQQLASR